MGPHKKGHFKIISCRYVIKYNIVVMDMKSLEYLHILAEYINHLEPGLVTVVTGFRQYVIM